VSGKVVWIVRDGRGEEAVLSSLEKVTQVLAGAAKLAEVAGTPTSDVVLSITPRVLDQDVEDEP
jgi:hypothetical protein